jgi:hypothetical protein
LNLVHMVVPSRTRRWLRESYDSMRFHGAMKRFVASPQGALAADSNVLPELIAAWGNSGWIAQEDYLRSCIATALTATGPTLECGSGLSTLLLGAVAQQRGHEHWALEHAPMWGERVGRYLARYRLHAVRLSVAPLRTYDGFQWYDPPLSSMPPQFTLVVCDGPPGSTTGGRYGLVPVMRPYLAPGCVILLDDAEREQERAIARRWAHELDISHHLVDGDKPFIRLAVASHPQ